MLPPITGSANQRGSMPSARELFEAGLEGCCLWSDHFFFNPDVNSYSIG